MSLLLPTTQFATSEPLEERFSGLPELTLAAINLYRMGLNVFPVPRPEEVRLKAKMNPQSVDPAGKIPYILSPLFFHRMHLCDETCHQRELVSGRRCPGSKPGLNFIDLFRKANVAVLTGRLSGNLAVIDCDDQKSFREIITEFDNRCLPYCGYLTNRGGNLAIRVKEGEINNLTKTNFSHVEIWGRQHYCVLPPSVHNSGVIYTWLEGHDPTDKNPNCKGLELISINELRWMGVTLHSKKAKILDLFGLPEFTSHISEANRIILSDPINKGERNNLLTKVAYDIAANIQSGNIPYDKAVELLYWKADKCNPPFPHIQIDTMLKSAFNKAELTRAKDYYGEQISGVSNSFIVQALSFSKSYDWRKEHGRYHLTDRAVFQVLCNRAKLNHSISFRASYREIMDQANIQSHQTIRNSLFRLIKKDLISRSGIDPSGACKYSFCSRVTAPHCSTISTCNTSATVRSGEKYDFPTNPLLQDIFSSLGRVSEHIFLYLQDNPEPDAATIAHKCNLAISSTRKALNKMCKLGLVSFSTAEMLYYVEDFKEGDLINFCNSLYVYGKSDKRRKKNILDQEINVNRLMERAQNYFIRS